MPKIYNTGCPFKPDIRPAKVAEKSSQLSARNVKFLKSLGYKVKQNGYSKRPRTTDRG